VAEHDAIFTLSSLAGLVPRTDFSDERPSSPTCNYALPLFLKHSLLQRMRICRFGRRKHVDRRSRPLLPLILSTRPALSASVLTLNAAVVLFAASSEPLTKEDALAVWTAPPKSASALTDLDANLDSSLPALTSADDAVSRKRSANAVFAASCTPVHARTTRLTAAALQAVQ
jgi:hypothetical protein